MKERKRERERERKREEKEKERRKREREREVLFIYKNIIYKIKKTWIYPGKHIFINVKLSTLRRNNHKRIAVAKVCQKKRM